jgi:hypothetical protein
MTPAPRQGIHNRVEVCLISADEMHLASRLSASQQNRLTRQSNMATNNLIFLAGLSAPAALTVALRHQKRVFNTANKTAHHRTRACTSYSLFPLPHAHSSAGLHKPNITKGPANSTLIEPSLPRLGHLTSLVSGYSTEMLSVFLIFIQLRNNRVLSQFTKYIPSQ